MKRHTIPMLLVVVTTTLAACMQKPQQAPPAPEEKPDPLAALQLDTLDEDSLDLKYATEMLRPGTAAPEFALPTLTGDTLRLSDFGGKWLVLDFWASWCPDCRQDVPNIQRLYETYHDRGIAFAAISFDTDREVPVSTMNGEVFNPDCETIAVSSIPGKAFPDQFPNVDQ